MEGVQTSSQFPPVAELPSLGVEGDELLAEVDASLRTLRGLGEHSELLGGEVVIAMRHTVSQVRARLNRNELCVVLAGEPGSGKTTFLDAILGDTRVSAARGKSRTATFIRRRATPRFRARLEGGQMADFASLVPDRQREMDEQLLSEEEAFAKAESRHAAFALKEESAREALQRAENELTQVLQALKSQTEAARALDATIGSSEMAAQHGSQVLIAVEPVVPKSLRAPKGQLPPWSWPVLVVFKLFYWGRWKRFADAREQRDAAQARLAEMRQRAEAAAAACRELDARAAELQADAWKKRGLSELAGDVMSDAYDSLEEARAKLDALHKKFSREVEERQARFFAEIDRLSGPDAGQVVEMAIDFPADFLPDGVVILDVPGVTEGDDAERAWNLVREEADGCILVSDLKRGISDRTKSFLERLREIVPHVLLVLSKMDAAFVEARDRGSAEPWDEVEQARRAGTRQFAEQIGRSPDNVLSIAVAALPAIEDPDSGLAKRFEEEVRKLFKLLRHERAMILGTRAAAALRSCIAASADAEQRAEAAYRERIAQMEADQVPEPEVFHRKAMANAEADVREGGRRAVHAATQTTRALFAELRRKCGDTIRSSAHQGQFREVALGTEQALAADVEGVQQEALQTLRTDCERAVCELEQRVFDAMKERYRITEEVVSARDSSPGSTLALPRVEMARTVGVRGTLTRHTLQRLALSVVGALVFGGVGMLVAAVPGAAGGAALGTLLAFARTRRSIERRVTALVEAALRKEEVRVLRDLETLEAGARSNIHAALDHSIENAIIRFGRFIAEPYQAGEQALTRERESLGRLRDLEAALERHDKRLDELMTTAAAASRGLCQ